MLLLKKILLLFGIEKAHYLTTLHEIAVDSWIANWLWPFLVVATTAFSIYLYSKLKTLNRRQQIVLSILRTLAYLSLLFIIARPALRIEGEGAFPGSIPIVVDASESMSIKDVNGISRIKRALNISKMLAEYSDSDKELDFNFYAYGKTLHPFSQTNPPTANGGYTSLNQMLQCGIRKSLGEYCPGLLILTDGAHNTTEIPEHSWDLFRKRGIPIYSCGIGKEKSRDIAVTYMLGEDVAFLDEKAKLYVNLTQNGYTTRDVTLRLLLGDEEVYNSKHTLKKEGEISIPVEYTPQKKGRFQLKAEISPLSDEITLENNSYVKNVRIIDEKIKILMLFGSPSWEYRYLIGSFERDKRVDMTIYLPTIDKKILDGKRETGRYTTILPLTSKSLHDSFDIVMISRINIATLPSAFRKAVLGFVKDKAGSIAILSDPAYIPFSMKNTVLESLLPVRMIDANGRSYTDELLAPQTESFLFVPTEDGLSNPLIAFSGNTEENRKIWEELPPVFSCYKSKRLKPSAINLMSLKEKDRRTEIPAIVHHSYGKGTVLFMAFDSTWRWRKEFGNRYFRDFWGKAVQFLGLPHLLNESARSTLFVGNENTQTGEPIVIRASVSNPDFSPFIGESLPLTITNDGIDKSIMMTPVAQRPGMYKAEHVQKTAGVLKLQLPDKFSARPIEISVIKRQREFQNPGMNSELLSRMAKSTGGRFFADSNGEDICRVITENRPQVPIKIRVSLWDTVFFTIITLLLFGTEWLFRKLYYLD